MADRVRASQMTVGSIDLDRIARRFGLSALERFGGFENVLLRPVDRSGRIVRLTHTSRRSAELIEAEVAFMQHLAGAGVPVVAPVHSSDGNLIEPFRLDDGSNVIAYCKTEAPGRIKGPHEWGDDENRRAR